jgi:hypothetical protein
MMTSRNVAVAGALLLFAGAFAPIASLPVVGDVSFLTYGKSVALFVLAMALLGSALAYAGHMRLVLWPGLGALAMLGFKFYRLQSGVDGAAQVQWGWAVLLLGALLMIWAGVAARRQLAEAPGADPLRSGGAPDTDNRG